MNKNIIIKIIPIFFLLGCNSKEKISNGYYLKTNEDGPIVYYLANSESEAGGVFDGTVSQVGWKRDEIMAKVRRLASVDPSGYYKLDLKTGYITGPIINDEEISKLKMIDVSLFYENPKAYKQK